MKPFLILRRYKLLNHHIVTSKTTITVTNFRLKVILINRLNLDVKV